MAEASRTTGYDRVREILDAAAGDSTADYEGVGRFWHLPLEELQEFRLQGIRLIAPAEKSAGSSCCSGAATTGRSATSGLVQGLRGGAPFDGSRFPRLPWGGRPVSDDDIRTIAEQVVIP